MVSNDERPSLTTRRTLLRSGVGLAATALTVTVSGCASGLPPLGSARRFGRIDPPPADPPHYRRWLPAPAAVSGLDRVHYPFLYRRPDELDYPAPVRFTTPRKRLRAELDHFGVGYAAYHGLLASPLGTVVEADVDTATVVRTLTESGYRADGSYHGYDRFARDDVPRRAAVGEDAVVWASDRVHDHPSVETLLDARAGRVDRYHEANDDVARLTDAVGGSRMVEFVPPEGDRTWSKCEGFRFADGTAYHVVTFRYPAGETPPEAELRERSREGTILTRPVENSDFRIDGRLVTVEGRIPPGAGIDPADIDPPYPPQITWGVARDDDPTALAIRHEAGETIPADALELRFGTDDPDALLVDAASRPFTTDTDAVGPGDAATVDPHDPPSVGVIHPDDVDHDAEDPYADADSWPATRVEVAFVSGSTARTLFGVALEDPR